MNAIDRIMRRWFFEKAAKPYWCPLCGEKGLPDLLPEATCRSCGKQPYALHGKTLLP